MKKLHRVLEYTNHLSNVLTVLSDKKLYNSTTQTYSAQIISTSDYYPFGLSMYGKQYDSGRYRFGFNGMEKNPELNDGNYDFGARCYDGRVGRWWSVDPQERLTASLSPYRFGFNSPIRYADPNGEFEIDKVTAAKYPKFAAYLKRLPQIYNDKPEEFRRIFKKYSSASDEQIRQILEYKELDNPATPPTTNNPTPRIIVLNLKKANGMTVARGTIMPKTATKPQSVIMEAVGIIHIDRDIVEYFEKHYEEGTDDITEEYEVAEYIIESTLFHEVVHYSLFVNTNKGNATDEAGNETEESGISFEEAAYGTNVGSSILIRADGTKGDKFEATKTELDVIKKREKELEAASEPTPEKEDSDD